MRVEAIRSKDIEKVFKYLETHEDKRRYCIFIIGINTGLRVSDLIKLKVKDIKGKDYLVLIEQKTKKKRKLIIHEDIKEIINTYYADANKNDYLFKSQKGDHISEVQVWRWFKEVKKKCRLKYNIGTHSMRKSLGRKLIEENEIEVVQKVLGHSNAKYTLEYLGIEKEKVDKAMTKINWRN